MQYIWKYGISFRYINGWKFLWHFFYSETDQTINQNNSIKDINSYIFEKIEVESFLDISAPIEDWNISLDNITNETSNEKTTGGTNSQITVTSVKVTNSKSLISNELKSEIEKKMSEDLKLESDKKYTRFNQSYTSPKKMPCPLHLLSIKTT